MKRELFVLFFGLILLGFVSAQTNNSSQSLKDTSLDEIQKDVKDLKSELENKSTYSNLTKGIKNTLNNDPDLPSWLENVSRILFGIDNDKSVTLSNVVLMITFFFIMISLIKGILDFSSFSSASNWTISICLAVISSVTGVYFKLIMSLFNFFNNKIGMSLLTMFLILFVAAGLIFLIIRFLNPFKVFKEISESEELGFKAGFNSKMSNKTNKALSDAVNDSEN